MIKKLLSRRFENKSVRVCQKHLNTATAPAYMIQRAHGRNVSCFSSASAPYHIIVWPLWLLILPFLADVVTLLKPTSNIQLPTSNTNILPTHLPTQNLGLGIGALKAFLADRVAATMRRLTSTCPFGLPTVGPALRSLAHRSRHDRLTIARERDARYTAGAAARGWRCRGCE